MTADELRQIENFVLSRPLSDVNAAENLQFLARLIVDHDHLREKLMTEPDREKRRLKFDAMRHYLDFAPDTVGNYEAAECLRRVGIQPIYQEQERYKVVR